MKIFKISFMLIFLILSACSYAAPSPPTATIQASPIVLPSVQVSPTASLFSLPTETPTQEPVIVTDIVQPSDTPLPTFTPTSGLIMEIVSVVPQPAAQAQVCGRPLNWAAYTVQRGDTLSSLAQRTGMSTQQIQTANCLAGTLIFAGQVLYLPFVPAPQVSGGNSSSTGTTAVPTVVTPKTGLPGDHVVTVSPSSGPPGTKFTLSVDQYASNEEVYISILFAATGDSVLDLILFTDSNGDLVWVYPSPTNAAPGNYNVFENGQQSKAAGKGQFTISAP